MDKSTRASDGLPRRVSASKAAASFAHQLDSDESSDHEVNEDVMMKDKLLASIRKERAEVKAQYGKNKFRARASSINGSPTTHHGVDTMSTTSVVVSSSHRPSPLQTNKKGLLYLATDPLLITESDASDLTSLSSSTPTSPIANLVPTPTLYTPPKVVPLAARRGLEHGQLSELSEPAWSVNDLGSYVWVLLEPKSNRVYNPDRNESDCKERLWWPAKIHGSRNTDVPLKIFLFGSGSMKVEIKTPSAKNILSKLDMIGRPRFAKPTFVSPSSNLSNEPRASPRKKLKRDLGDIEKRWQAAVWEMIHDGEEQAGSDHLPDIGEAFNYHLDASPTTSSPVVPNVGNGRSKGKGKRKRTCDSDDEVFWEPPPADANVDIPGDLVLGRASASKQSDYWPAKIKDYVPPTKRTEQGKYTVIWLDAAEQNIPRDWFYTMDEDGFALCKLGKFESSISEVFNDEDEDEDEDLRCSASPIPLDRPPNDEMFSNLSIREQFVYTKTVLRAIMNDEYEPTRSKNSRFMNGGKQRASLTDEAALRGKMDPKDVERLQTYIRQWCLRDEAPADDFVDEIENHNHPEVITDVQEEPLNTLGLDYIRSGSDPLTESYRLSLPPSSSCPSISLEHETPLSSDILPTASPSVLESEPPPSSAATEPIIGRLTSDSPLQNVKTRPAKQQGCEEYESLSRLEKIEYCLNILLPEAIRQILLWRSGKRTSTQLLSSEEEEDLYQEGQTLLNETDWVFDIMRYRQMKQRRQQPKNPKGKNGTTSRPSRGFNAPNYAE